MQATPLIPFAVFFALAALAGCDDERSQVCVPGVADRCAEGQTCNVDSSGTPRCITPGDQPEGALCVAAPPGIDDADPAGRCQAELGCLRVAGVSRCLRFCDPSARVDPCPEDTVGIGAAGIDLADFARCAAVLPDRPEIGICVLPCRADRRRNCIDDPADCRAHPGDCPGETTCGISPAAPYSVCVPTGEAALGEPCGPRAACAAGLLCTRLDGDATCRRPVDLADTCPEGSAVQPLAGTADPFGGEAGVQKVCLP